MPLIIEKRGLKKKKKKRKERSQNDNLTFHIKTLEREVPAKPTASKKKDIREIKIEINEIKNRKYCQNMPKMSMKLEGHSLKKINKIDILLVKLIRKKTGGKKRHISKIGNAQQSAGNIVGTQ